MAEIKKIETVASGRFLKLQKLTFVNDDGKELKWEACQRTNNVNAVSIFAINPQKRTVILVRQFRPPVGKYCIECPAGLIEEGESVLESAKRELLEETGYTIASVLEEGFAAENSAGMIGELTTPIVALVDENVPQQQQALDDSEHIELLEVPLDKLYDFLNEANANGDVVNGKLLTFTFGLKFGNWVTSFPGCGI